MRPAAILYYFPGDGPGGGFGEPLRAIPPGLRPKFARHTRQDRVAGPDRGAGLLVTWQENVAIGYSPETQTWRKTGAFWRGFRNDYLAEEFTKAAPPASGYRVRLGDGREYVIPVALADAPNYDIPWREGLDGDGNLTREVAPEYATVCRVARTLWEALETTGRLQADDADLRAACAAAIAVNYQLDLDDCLFLGLLTSESYQGIVRAILDIPALEGMLANPKAHAGPSADFGGPASSEASDLPTPTFPSATAKDSAP